MTEGKKREAVEALLERIGVKVKIEEVQKIKGNVEKGTELIWVRLKNREGRFWRGKKT